MRTATHSPDEQLLVRLSAPPALGEGVESLSYWRERRVALPWYRFGARREAARMIIRWEERVAAAILARDGATLTARLSVGVLLAQMRLGRWRRRTARGLAATATVVLFAAPAIAVVVALMHVL